MLLPFSGTASSPVPNLRSWRYCLRARFKFLRRRRDPKKGSGDEGVSISISIFYFAARDGFAAKFHSTTTRKNRQLRRLSRPLK